VTSSWEHRAFLFGIAYHRPQTLSRTAFAVFQQIPTAYIHHLRLSGHFASSHSIIVSFGPSVFELFRLLFHLL
jgi:hypothetical protein